MSAATGAWRSRRSTSCRPRPPTIPRRIGRRRSPTLGYRPWKHPPAGHKSSSLLLGRRAGWASRSDPRARYGPPIEYIEQGEFSIALDLLDEALHQDPSNQSAAELASTLIERIEVPPRRGRTRRRCRRGPDRHRDGGRKRHARGSLSEARFAGLSFSHIQRVIRKGELRVNGRRADCKDRLETGQSVRIPPLRARCDESGRGPSAAAQEDRSKPQGHDPVRG